MSDLVARLRGVAPSTSCPSLLVEAAEELERLERTIMRLQNGILAIIEADETAEKISKPWENPHG